MASRKGSIIAIAEAASNGIFDSLAEDSKRKANAEVIRNICRSLVSRRTPQIPTADAVSESGANVNPHFPRAQTIYNTPAYSRMLGVWRTAFRNIICIDTSDPLTTDMVSKIDTSAMDTSNVVIVERLKQIVFELTQRCNALKRIIDEGVPVPASGISPDASELISQLGAWIRSIEYGPFELNDIALKVGRRTPPGTIIMMSDLFNELRTFVADFQNLQRARSARDKGDG